MEMSQNLFLISNFTKNTYFFEKMANKHFFGQKFCDKLKNNFELIMLKLLENHVKTQL